MFDWIKNKFNNLTPKDVDDGFMTSNFCSIKLGAKLTLPSNLKCLVCYKDKLYLELNEGSYVLDDKNLVELCKKQKIKDRKKLKIDLFFINTNTFSTKFKYVDKIPIKKQKSKQTFSVEYTANVTDSRKFADTILNFYASVFAWQSIDFVSEMLEEQIIKYFAHKTLQSAALPMDMQEEIKTKCGLALQHIGINLQDFAISFSNKTLKEVEKPETKTSSFSFFEINTGSKVPEQPEVKQEPKKLEALSNETRTQETQNNLCPVCKHKIISGSVYCHVCGYEFKQNKE